MIVALRADVRARLEAIKVEDGMLFLDQVVQAVEVWSHLTTPERRTTGLIAMQLVVARTQGDRT